MKVEIVKEPEFSQKKCIKLIAENQAEEAILDDFFQEKNGLEFVDFFYSNETKAGLNEVTLYSKLS